MITETRMVVMPTTRHVRSWMTEYNRFPEFCRNELTICVSATLAEDPASYLTDVHAQRLLGPDQLEEAVESSLSLCDVLFHEYHAYFEPLREDAEATGDIFAVRDLMYNHQQWGFILQRVHPEEKHHG